MKLLTKPIQSGGDYVFLDLNPDYVHWLLDVRRDLLRHAAQRPQNECLWTVFTCTVTRFLQSKHCQYDELSQFDEEIKNKTFAQLPEYFDVPLTRDVEVEVREPIAPAVPAGGDPGFNGPRDQDGVYGGRNDPPETQLVRKNETRNLDVDASRLYVVICQEGFSWHCNVRPSKGSYGERALSTPRLPVADMEKLFGITPAAEPELVLPPQLPT